MPLALLVLSTVPVRLSVRNTSCPLHISYTLFYQVGGYNGFALSRPSDGRSVGLSSVAGVCCGNAVRTPLWCDMGLKYITMSEIYAVLVLWNIILYYYTSELYSILTNVAYSVNKLFLDLVTLLLNRHNPDSNFV